MGRNKRTIFAVLMLLAGLSVFSQATCGLSVGGGFGFVRHQFTDNGRPADLDYAAPGFFFDGELAWGRWYMDMALSALLCPVNVSLGGETVDLDGYTMNYAMDFTAIGIGYMYPVNKQIEVGGAFGFHVSGIALSPPNEDPDLLTLEGYYGTIGLSIVPRVRYRISDSLRCTLSIPIGLDFGPMSDEVVTFEGPTGLSNPAVVRPANLVPEFRGFTLGLNISIGYFFTI